MAAAHPPLPSFQHAYDGLPALSETEVHRRRESVFLVFAGVFLGTLAMLNILGITRFIDLSFTVPGLGWRVPMPLAVGVLPYPITFLCTDFISELYGRQRANFVVFVGLLINIWVMSILGLGGVLPGAEGSDAGVFFAVRNLAFGAVTASMIAYLAAQLIDVHVFHFWKQVTSGRHLWLRNNGSTLVSQLVASIAVILVTHYYAHALPIDEARPVAGQLVTISSRATRSKRWPRSWTRSHSMLACACSAGSSACRRRRSPSMSTSAQPRVRHRARDVDPLPGLAQHRMRAHRLCALLDFGVRLTGDDHHASRMTLSRELGQHLQPAHPRHAHVEKQQARLVSHEGFQRRDTVTRLDHARPETVGQVLNEGTPRERRIIDDENGHGVLQSRAGSWKARPRRSRRKRSADVLTRDDCDEDRKDGDWRSETAHPLVKAASDQPPRSSRPAPYEARFAADDATMALPGSRGRAASQ